MSTTIDEKVVEMRFDNKNFESNIKTSLSTLDKLKESLKLDGAAKGLETVRNTASKIDMNPLGSAVEGVKIKFSALQVMAITALSNITTSAMAAGKNLLSSFTTDPIKTGLEEYETQINAVQTILANTSSKGTTLDQVNAALDELNTYADKTIYNFTEMTRNIGTFTAAGLDLQTSTSAIQGIANVAAVSGSTSQQASTAMYQLSQALSSGTVKLQDWNSVVNAGMGGQVFQDALKQTSRECVEVAKKVQAMSDEEKKAYQQQHNYTDDQMKSIQEYSYNVDKLIESEGSFRESLSKGWITSDVLARTLNAFTKSGVVDYISEMTGASKESVTELQNLGDRFGYDSDKAKEMALSISGGNEELANTVLSTVKMATTAEDAATKVKTFSQLMDTLKEAAQSGWTQSWEILIGDFEEAKALWTSVSDYFGDAINKTSEARNKILQTWKDTGGREMLFASIKNAFDGLLGVITPVKEAFREIFPAMTGNQLTVLTTRLWALTEKFKLSTKASQNLKATFKGIFAVLDIVGQAFKAVGGGIADLISYISPAGDGILGLTAKFGRYLVKLDYMVKETNFFGNVIGKVVSTIISVGSKASSMFGVIANNAKTLWGALKEKIEFPSFELFNSILERIQGRTSQVGGAFGRLKTIIVTAFKAIGDALTNCDFIKVLQILWDMVKNISSGIVDALGGMMSTLVEKLGNADFNGIFDVLNVGMLGGIALGIRNFLKNLESPLEGVSGILDSVKGILDGVRGCLEAYQQNLKANVLLKIAAAIGILAVAIIAISLIDSEKLASSLGAITALFGELLIAMAIFTKISDTKSKTLKASAAMIAMSLSVLILAGAMKTLASLEWSEITKGLVAVGGLAAIIVASTKIMSSQNKRVIKGATSLIIFAAAIKILASVCKDLSTMSWDEIGHGLAAVGGLMLEISIFLRTAKFSGKAITTATGIVILSAAIKILASVCKDFASYSWEEIGKGLASVGALLTEIAIFTRLTGKAKHVISTGIALIAIAAAMKILASAMKDFGTISWEEMGRGLSAMGGALAEIVIAMNLLPKGMIGKAAGLVVVGAALEILSNVMSKMSSFSWDEIGRGLALMGGALVELAIGLNLMKGTLGGSAALLVAATAFLILTPAMKMLGAMSWESIAKGLAVLAGTFIILGVAGAVLAPLIPAIIGLGVAFGILGVSVLAIGAGLLALSIAFGALAVAGTVGATAVAAALTIIITGIAKMIPVVVKELGRGFVEFCKVISESAPAIAEAVKAIVLNIVDVLVECVPELANGALELFYGVLKALAENTPKLIDAFFEFIIGIINGLSRKMPELIQAVANLIKSIFGGIMDALGDLDGNTLLKVIEGIGLFSVLTVALSAIAGFIPGAMVGVLGLGAVIAEMAIVLAAVGALAQIPGLTWLIGEGGNLLQSIGTAIGQFLGGIAGGIMTGVSSQFPQIGSDLSAFMTNVQPFLDGASSIDPSMMDGVNALAKTILLLTGAEILDALTSWFTGGSSLASFGEQLIPFGQSMMAFSQSISGIDTDTVSNAAIAGKAIAEMATSLPNSGGVVGFFTGENDIDTFGAKLPIFGTGMLAFSMAVKGMDAEAVTNAANAGKAVAAMAESLPNSGGVVGFFTGENDIDTFGAKLPVFGAGMLAFSMAVKGMDAEAVSNAAVAGKAVAEMATSLPNSGGVVGFFTGENDIDTFGAKLPVFGAGIKSFADSVTGIDTNAVTNATIAGEAIVELANTLPNSGGIFTFFSGDNNIEDFGKDLRMFGIYFSLYASSMEDVDAGVLTTTTNAAKSIVELANSLPDTGGWFSGKMDMKDFGDDLKSFGLYFSEFYAYIKDIDIPTLTGFIAQVQSLVTMTSDTVDMDTSGLDSLNDSLTDLAEEGIADFLDTFANADSDITSAISGMFTSISTAITDNTETFSTSLTTLLDSGLTAMGEKHGDFEALGKAFVLRITSGANDKSESIKATFKSLVSGAVTAISEKYQSFYNAGRSCASQLSSGLKSVDISSSFNSGLNSANTAVRNYRTTFYTAGAYLVEGFRNGINDNIYLAEAKAREMARRASDAAKKQLNEHSPSKVGYEIGDFFGIGFVNGIANCFDMASEAGQNIADSAKTSLSNAVRNITEFVDDNVDTQPTIRPVLDLTDVESKAGSLNAMFSRTQAMSIGSRMNQELTADIQNGDVRSKYGTTFSFTQNNYSPKALSRADIYRQTKNQFSAIERMVGV